MFRLFRLGFDLNIMLYPKLGRRSIWASVQFGQRTWWLNRHPEYQLESSPDARRLSEPRSPMCWRVGTFTTNTRST